MKGKGLFFVLCMLSIVIASIGPNQAVQAGTSPPPNTVGPYTVGFVQRTFYDADRASRPVVTYIWYPADPQNNGSPMLPALYPIDPLGLWGGPVVPSTVWEAYGLDPAYQEVAVSKNGPFPLVIFSPGLGLDAFFYLQIGARLASYGFVVVILTNYGDGLLGEPVKSDLNDYYAWTAIDRVNDVKYLITRLSGLTNEPGDLLYQMIRPDQIAVAGHSWGGYATLALAGGDDTVCDNEPGYPLDSCIPILPDNRIKAIVAIDGSGWVLHFYEMARIKIPHLGIGEEWNAVYDWLARQHAAIQGTPNYRVDIAYAYHVSFANACEWWNVLDSYGLIDDTYYWYWCPTFPVPAKLLQDLTSMYMVAFLKTVLVGETGYQSMLTSGYALKNQPLAEFFVTEKRNPNAITQDWPAYFTYFMHQPGSETARALKDPLGLTGSRGFPPYDRWVSLEVCDPPDSYHRLIFR